MSLAIKYKMQQKARMADGGVCEHGSHMCPMCHGGKMAEGGIPEEMPMPMPRPMDDRKHRVADSMKKAFGSYSDGGFVHEEEASGYEKMPEEYAGDEESEDEDRVGRIMRKRHYSKGGRVANETPIKADFEENQFDDLAKDDDLEFHETGANSGDELGDEQEDDDRRDIVKRIMKSRSKKDRMPRPA